MMRASKLRTSAARFAGNAGACITGIQHAAGTPDSGADAALTTRQCRDSASAGGRHGTAIGPRRRKVPFLTRHPRMRRYVCACSIMPPVPLAAAVTARSSPPRVPRRLTRAMHWQLCQCHACPPAANVPGPCARSCRCIRRAELRHRCQLPIAQCLSSGRLRTPTMLPPHPCARARAQMKASGIAALPHLRLCGRPCMPRRGVAACHAQPCCRAQQQTRRASAGAA